MKIKKVLAWSMACCMVAALPAGCAGGGDRSRGAAVPEAPAGASASTEAVVDSNGGSGGESVTATSVAAPAPGQAGGETSAEPEDVVDVNMWLIDFGTGGLSGSKWSLVESAINDYTEENLGIHINFTWLNVGEYATQVQMAIANNEPIDIVTTIPFAGGNPSLYFANNMALDISGYLEEYGQGIIGLMGGADGETNLLDACRLPDGGIYGIPTYRILNQNLYAVYRTDVLEEIGMLEEFKAMESWGDFEEILKAISALDGMYGIGGSKYIIQMGSFALGNDKFSDIYYYDSLGDGSSMICTDDDGHVSLSYANPDILDSLKMAADWYAKGYVYPDTYLTDEGPEALITRKIVGGYLCGSEYGVESIKAQACQTDMTCVELAKGKVNSLVCAFGVIVPVTSAEPEAAVRLLNALYTTPELMELLDYGVEGETYVRLADGQCDYPEGTTNTTCGYHMNDYLVGNQFITSPWVGTVDGASFRENSLNNFLEAPVSPYLGLTVDTAEISPVLSAAVALKAEYEARLTSGLYTDELYGEFLAKLDGAGIDEYIAFFQAAVDGFRQ